MDEQVDERGSGGGVNERDEPSTIADSVDPKERLAAFYSRVAPAYAEHGPPWFDYAARRLVELAAVGEGDVVLDVATGRGAVLFAAAQRVGHTGQAVGIDVAPGMVERTRAAIAEQALQMADVRVMDAEHLTFADASFTRVLCSFAVFFFAELATVLAQMRRVLQPGGVVGFAFSRGVDPRWAWYEDLLRAYGALNDLPRMPGNGAIRQAGALESALASAGFIQVREQVEEVELFFPDAESWWRSLWTHGSRRPLEHLSPERVAEIRAVCLERARALGGPHGLPERHRFVYVTGVRPGAR